MYLCESYVKKHLINVFYFKMLFLYRVHITLKLESVTNRNRGCGEIGLFSNF